MTDTYSPTTSAIGQAAFTPQRQTAAAPGAADRPAVHELMSPEVNVQRIMWTGTIWFAAAVGAVAVTLGFLLSSGWRPAMLSTGDEIVFWIGATVVALSIGLIGWSGCPILEVDVPTADKNKSRTMQFGTAMFIGGGAITLFAILLGP
ncbi:hypothetical protein HD599_001895 [Conyzicola lurida]|uniref:Uncharacterized protein n=1 Tax=Conyzicola lurida TaxID=1172621 RepID=A0A841ANP0_9MICO|nr:hypothetical protein [Conyzicola lurida]MBB5843572.1 hypothetical protein [Conyzicola lurida]